MKAELVPLLDELGGGGPLPAERDLAVRFEVSRETVRQALRELLLEGRLRRAGRGTVVAGPKLEQPLSLAGYTEGVRRQGRLPGRTLIGLERRLCPARLAGELAGERGTPAWRMERVLLSRDTEGRPLERRVRSLYRGDRFSFGTRLRDRGVRDGRGGRERRDGRGGGARGCGRAG